ncbi:hypothetical protein R69927_00985 [Paraburkholderia domus]|jgi:hypothetical protein|uniref:Uncharacterized protein n=1 Tax=Paraburkholderia domus TaxID=2793075 RepID=A0A9N8ML34_9BURK|nr:hypothetical protein R70006_02324 [Paraburkholderia domus]CAE6769926.1 hypothetical protein R69749_01184 [Paraburkholderia domus]CAE6771020.1 hypothetical protein R75483_04010 [Paraburkholderia domus]CAE6828081.1 hypothetical protein R69927_00985 [Paraburkholderia domus]CAE6854687.1 hypothetical protein R70199_00518 [Paraburkholderia domus]
MAASAAERAGRALPLNIAGARVISRGGFTWMSGRITKTAVLRYFVN